MSVVTLLVILVAAGVLLWLVNVKIPMEGTIKTIINVVVIIIAIILVLNAFGFLPIKDVDVPKIIK